MFRARKVLENRNMGVEDQLSAQETQLRSVKEAAEERDRMYEEVKFNETISEFSKIEAELTCVAHTRLQSDISLDQNILS